MPRTSQYGRGSVSNLDQFLDHAGLTEHAATLQEFGIERVDDLKVLAADDFEGFGLSGSDTYAKVTEAAKTFTPDAPAPAAADDDDDDGGGDIKARLATMLAGGGPPGGPGGYRPPKSAQRAAPLVLGRTTPVRE